MASENNLSEKEINLLKKIYESPEHESSFTSPHQIRRTLKTKYKTNIPLKSIKDWLSGQRSYTFHKPVKHNFPGNPIIATHIDNQWEADLMFLPDLAKFNDGYKIALVCVDVVSRYAWVEPMKTKHGAATAEAMKAILARSAPRKPDKLHTDSGTEFFNKSFQKLMDERNIENFATLTDRSKAAIAERFNRTIKEKIYKFLDSNPANNRYIDTLQDLVNSYNNTYHSSIKMAPSKVNEQSEAQAIFNLYHKYWTDELDNESSYNTKSNRKTKFSYQGKTDFTKVQKQNMKKLLQIGDTVRIAGKKHPFSKSYKGNWTEELFIISKIQKRHPYFLYEVTEVDGQPIKGLFYREELQKVQKPKTNDFWQIEKIIKTKKLKNSKTKYFVKWFGYSDKYNSWVTEDDIKSTA